MRQLLRWYLPVFVIRLFITTLTAAALLSQTAFAEENLDLNSHLPFVAQAESAPPLVSAQTARAAQEIASKANASKVTIANAKIEQISVKANPTVCLPTSTQISSSTAPQRVSEQTTSASPRVQIAYAQTDPNFVGPLLPVDLQITAAAIDISASSNTQTGHNPGDIWQRIRNGFAMRELKSKLVRRHEKWYARHPEYVARISERSQRYLFYIIEEVERRGMPSEIALLPIIESAFNPGANSVARASGIWQFIPSTGKNFGMEQNWWYDGRRDIIEATNGALDYLQKLHGQFGDWELALAAYNWGENAVARAQARNRKRGKATNYSSLRMPRETRNYVPKLLAVKHIISDPARFGLTLNKIPNEPYFAEVKPSRPMDVKVAAALAEISMDEFLALNPANNRPVMLKDATEILLLPIDKVDVFQSNLEKYDQRLVSWCAYQTKKGESFSHVASRFGLSLKELRRANGLSKYARISNGQKLLVPAKDTHTAEFTAFNMHASAVSEMSGFRYKVRRGDTISAIARRFRVSQASLFAMNHGSSRLRIGQRFTILAGSSHPHRAKKHKRVHRVKAKRNRSKHRRHVDVAYR
ncbi:MAG: transglycosylase SLT domain-containing protein [Gallionellaceae bacterium]